MNRFRNGFNFNRGSSSATALDRPARALRTAFYALFLLAAGLSFAVHAQTPYSGSPISVPGTFEAENFDLGGEGVAYHDNVPGNQGGQYRAEDVDIVASSDLEGGGYVVNNFETGEWLAYTINVQSAALYDIEIRASTTFSTSAFHIEIDGQDVTGTIVVPSTSSWSAFQWVGKKGVPLAAGKHVLKVVADQQYFNLNSIGLTTAVADTQAPSIPANLAATVVSLKCFDPVPDPAAAGFTKEGTGTVTDGTPLELVDPGKGATEYVNLWCAEDPATFLSTITLQPKFLIQGSDPDGENTGIHASINDGVNVIRAVIFRATTGAYKVALLLANNGKSSEFTFGSTTVEYTLRRLVGDSQGPDGTAELTVPGTTFKVLADPSELPLSHRPAAKSIEFGTYTPVAASGTTRWDTLGLPQKPSATLNVSQVQVFARATTGNDKIKLQASFTAPSGSTVDPSTQDVFIKFLKNGNQFWPAATVNPIRQFSQSGSSYTINSAERGRTGINAFSFDVGWSMDLVDADAPVATDTYPDIEIELQIGSNTWRSKVTLRDAGNDKWVFP